MTGSHRYHVTTGSVFYPEGWRAEHLVAMFASGADWAVEEAGREGMRYWVMFQTY